MPSEDTCCAPCGTPCAPCAPCAPCGPSRPRGAGGVQPRVITANGQTANGAASKATKPSHQSQARTEMTTEQRTALGATPSCVLVDGGGCRGVGVGVGAVGSQSVGRAEAFARSLHHKLRSLGSLGSVGPTTDRPDSPDDMDDSWSSAPSGPNSHSGPLDALRTFSNSSVDSSSDLYYDLDFSPQSPQEEVTSLELAGMMAGSCNRDHLVTNGPQSPQSDCSSDYFDTDCFDEDRASLPGPADSTPPLTNGLTNGGGSHVNGHGPLKAEAKPKRPWNRVPHKYKAGTPEAMSEVSTLALEEADDDDEEKPARATKPAAAKPAVLMKLSFQKSSQTLLQEGLIEQLKQGHDIPPELKNGLCPSGTDDVPTASVGGLAAMKQMARTLEALATPDNDSAPSPAAANAAVNVTTGLAALRLNDEAARGDDDVVDSSQPSESCCQCEDVTETSDTPTTEESSHNGHAEENGEEDVEREEEDGEDRRPRIRRCSSLKTGKTPPGTPGRKKIVRFADVLGLDLADVRTFLDEIPKVPTSAYSDLQDVDPMAAVADGCLPSGLPQLALAFHTVPTPDTLMRANVTRVLVPLFQQPGGMADFLDRIRDRQACLENAVVADAALLSISGQVRVRNLDFHKTVHIRYTTDGWRSFADLQATYVVNSCDGFSDKFIFTLFAGHTMSVGQRLEMAVRFQCKGQQYWDNNSGANYCFQCLPPSTPQPMPALRSLNSLNSPSDDGWKVFF